MKKHLNVDLIQSELRGGSAFFPGYKADKPLVPSAEVPEPVEASQQASRKASVHPPEQLAERIGASDGVPLPVPPPVPLDETLVPRIKRPIKQRQPFDIYEDQYATLKKIAAAERGFINGRGMSQMVRDAIDTYLRDHGTARDKE